MSARDQVTLTKASPGVGSVLGTTLPAGSLPGLVIGRLVGFTDEGRTPLVAGAEALDLPALPAHSVIDLHGAHIGRRVVLAHEAGDPCRPIVLGLLNGDAGWPLRESVGQVEVSADGERMTVVAREQLVLRCGKASLLLRSDGRVEIRGETIVTQAAGANHVRGGSVQLN